MRIDIDDQSPVLVHPTGDSGRIWVVSLNRPHVRNAVDASLSEAMCATMDDFESNPEARVAVLTGRGSSFCSGMDLKSFAEGRGAVAGHRGFAGIVERPPVKPVLAAVEGHAYAGGFEIALACDLIVAGRSATFALPEVRRGLIAAAGGLIRLASKVPFNCAAEMALTGTPWTADRARGAGLVARVVDDGAALTVACELAEGIATNAPLAVDATKQLLAQSVGLTLADAFTAQREAAARIASSADAHEGAVAFTEKRPPDWCNR